MKSTTKSKRCAGKPGKIEYGNVELSPGDLDPRKVKFRVTMFLDLDLVEEIRHRAAADGDKYQPWINRLLRRVILGEKSQIDVTLERAEAVEKKMA